MLLKTILLSSVAFLLYIGIRRKRSLILNPPNIVNGMERNKINLFLSSSSTFRNLRVENDIFHNITWIKKSKI